MITISKENVFFLLFLNMLTKPTEYEKQERDYKELIKAVYHEDLCALREMVRAGADVNARSSSGDTILSMAILCNCLLSTKELLEAGADVNLGNRDGRRPIHCAVDCSDPCNAIALLLEHRADINAEMRDGWTALHWAAARGMPSVMKMLLDAGGDVHATVCVRRSPLYYAALHDNSDVFEMLLRSGSETCGLDTRDIKGRCYEILCTFLVEKEQQL